jgi:TrmH family RNA methyltransferase
MLSKAQEKLIAGLHAKKGRKKNGLCLIEGKKLIQTAGKAVQFRFGPKDSPRYKKLLSTDTPAPMAAIARIPRYTVSDVLRSPIIIALDGVQDPGNVGAIFRLCLGFDASLLLIESAHPTNPKVVRSSVGAMFQVPWLEIPRKQAKTMIENTHRPVYRLEKKPTAKPLQSLLNKKSAQEIILIAGSEGSGIKLPLKAPSIYIPHDKKLESLNVSQALAIALYMVNKG